MSHKAAVLPAKLAEAEIQELSTPSPGPGLLLVKIYSAAFNPVDYKIQKTGRFFETYPRVIGGDAAGTVEAVGEGVTRFKAGDRVTAFTPYVTGGAPGHKDTDAGGFQQYTIALPQGTALIPEKISFDEASTIPLALSTAADGFYSFLKLARPVDGPAEARNEWILVWGGASSVGQFAIQLAHQAGYKVIATASKAGHEFLKSLGADVTVDYRDPDAVKHILDATSGELRLAFDAISEDNTVPSVVAALPKGGKAAFVQKTPENGLGEASPPSNIEFVRVFAGNLIGKDKDTVGKFTFEWIGKALADGRLRGNPVELRKGGLGVVQATLDLYAKEGISGKKFVIRPQES